MRSKVVWLAVSLFLVAGLLLASFSCAKTPTPTAKPTPAPTVTVTATPAPAPTVTVAAPTVTVTATPTPTPTATIPAMKLKLASADPPPPTLRSVTGVYWEDMVTRLSGGKITFDNYWGGSLAGSAELLEALEKRVMDLTMMSAPWAAGKLPMWNAELVFPFRPEHPRTYTKMFRRLLDAFPAFSQELAQYKMKNLYLTPSAMGYGINSTIPIPTLADMKGKKIAAIGLWFPKFVTDGGGVAVSMPAPERYVALQRGVIEGHILMLDWVLVWKHQEVAKHFTSTTLGNTLPGGLMVNLDLWNSLTPAVQKIFLDAAKETEEYQLKLMDEMIPSYSKDFKAAGGTIYTMSKADETQWASQMADYPALWAQEQAAKGLPAWEFVNAFIKAAEAEGWVWPRQWGKR